MGRKYDKSIPFWQIAVKNEQRPEKAKTTP
jgi:hypothetical protein